MKKWAHVQNRSIQREIRFLQMNYADKIANKNARR